MDAVAPVIKSLLTGDNGLSFGRLTLNVPKTLNALTLEMVGIIREALDRWENDPGVVGVLIDGVGEKGFCAGGDVQALYRSAIERPGGPCEYAERFFADEYRMNYRLHTYAKPIVCWGHGIVMGGGLGIFAGCSHRVVTESTRFAMPEVTIALFPDVGGSYFLNRMPGHSGRFLALTAANFNATDGMDTGYGTVLLADAAHQSLLTGLQAQSWKGQPDENEQLLLALLSRLAAEHSCVAPAGNISRHSALIESLCSGTTAEVYQKIADLDPQDKWLSKARDGLLRGSPLAVLWIDRQLQSARELSLADALRSELLLATNVVRHPEFAEGVRALLVDKDRNPQWTYRAIEQVPTELVDQFFSAPWGSNPLSDLG